MTDTFSTAWVPQSGAQGQGTLRTREVQFGDGYVQEAPDGINTHLQQWPLTWTGRVGSAVDPVAIRDWIVAHVGQRFLWTPPRGEQGYYACKAYNLVPVGGDVYQLTATFLQRGVP
jgi:phage-related protein